MKDRKKSKMSHRSKLKVWLISRIKKSRKHCITCITDEGGSKDEKLRCTEHGSLEGQIHLTILDI